MFFSVIIPVYNRPDEIRELLESLLEQSYRNFEVLIVEDGSEQRCEHVVQSFSGKLNIRYFFKDNSGQGFSRNYGFERARGEYYIVFDSDCIIPPRYFETVYTYLQIHPLDAFGGPDRAHPSFTPLQKAISYSMTSRFTTGGIRGDRKASGSFHPRSFNMGISQEVFEKTGGYRITRMGEDLEFSIRIKKQGFKVGLIPDAFVYHKRRTSLRQFYSQLHFFGRARINVGRFHPDEIQPLHLLPALFTLGCCFFVTTPFWQQELFVGMLSLGLLGAGMIAIDAVVKYRSLRVGLLSVITSFVQLFAYGMGFLSELWAE
ncbi:MAG: glycosyltransferase, partial [Balneolaceae bacterium]|nr:glycosyltransferase [Balneolaceae bacterium]